MQNQGFGKGFGISPSSQQSPQSFPQSSQSLQSPQSFPQSPQSLQSPQSFPQSPQSLPQSPQPVAQDEGEIGFEIGSKSIFSTWSAVLLAVEHEFGGIRTLDKIKNIYEDLMDLFYDRKKTIDYLTVEEHLEDAFSEDLRLEFEQGDLELRQVSILLTKLYDECTVGNYNTLNLVLKKNVQKDPVDKIWGGLKATEFPLKDEAPQLIPINSLQNNPFMQNINLATSNIHFPPSQNPFQKHNNNNINSNNNNNNNNNNNINSNNNSNNNNNNNDDGMDVLDEDDDDDEDEEEEEDNEGWTVVTKGRKKK